MRKIIQWGGALGLALTVSSCGLLDAGGAAGPQAGPPVVITQNAPPSALVAVLGGRAAGPDLSGLISATARPLEDLAVLQAVTPSRVVLSSDSPAPPTVVIPGQPVPPGPDETTYVKAQYAARLKHWRSEVVSGRNAEAVRAHGVLSAWVRGLGLQARLGRQVDPPGSAGGLVAEAAAAASALSGLEENGNVFDGRRVLLLYSNDLAGRPPVGELAGDTVLVITRRNRN